MKYIIIFTILSIGIQAVFAQGIRSKVNNGNTQFEQGKYEEALSQYQDALLDDPINEKIIFNKGDALYKLQKYDEAVAEFQKILGSEDLQLSAKALHNIGNAYFTQDKLQESIDAYKRSLELNPDDFDTKYNLELARAKLKEMAEKKPQDQNQQNQQNQQNKDQQSQEQQQNEQKQDQQDQEQQNQEGQEQQAAEEEQEQQPQDAQDDKEKMEKDEAERILNALNEEEQDSQEKKAPIKVSGRRSSKDW